MEQVLLVRYGEIHLKGLNRPFFERKLIDGITYEALAEEVGMSPRGVKYVVNRHKNKVM